MARANSLAVTSVSGAANNAARSWRRAMGSWGSAVGVSVFGWVGIRVRVEGGSPPVGLGRGVPLGLPIGSKEARKIVDQTPCGSTGKYAEVRVNEARRLVSDVSCGELASMGVEYVSGVG